MGSFEKSPEKEEWFEFSPLSVHACRARESSPKLNNSIDTMYFGGAIDELGVIKGRTVSEEMAQMMALYGTLGFIQLSPPYLSSVSFSSIFPLLSISRNLIG